MASPQQPASSESRESKETERSSTEPKEVPLKSTSQPNSPKREQFAQDVRPSSEQDQDDVSEDESLAKDNKAEQPGSSEGPSPDAFKLSNSSAWVLVLNDPNYNHYPYYMNTNGLPSQTDEPQEPYYVYDTTTAQYEPTLRQPSGTAANSTATDRGLEEAEEYQGYNPKIHGKYDPNASYNDYHKRKRETESAAEAAKRPKTVEEQYAAMGAFNRFTGQFQTGDQSTERHDDYHKSGRQMGAFFDVDAAANAHGGRSLKEERRNQKLSGKQLREMREKQKQRKEDKKRQWLLS